MSHRHRLRLVVLPAVVAGAMLVPVSAAVASDGKPTPSASVADEEKSVAEKKKEDAAKERSDKDAAAKKAAAAKEASGQEKMTKEKAAKKAAAAKQAPRGGVAAGEAPAEDSATATLVGSAAGALLLAGAGTFVVRRRSAARRGV
ncbi:hypothetical protein ACFT9I_16900 [Streptomyces sp. NPDC057137]|uniref:hypothetical protein n=1 Tax=Streptomyces sp. NPDC057137 TaxID=3346030 RepID=UPI003636920E